MDCRDALFPVCVWDGVLYSLRLALGSLATIRDAVYRLRNGGSNVRVSASPGVLGIFMDNRQSHKIRYILVLHIFGIAIVVIAAGVSQYEIIIAGLAVVGISDALLVWQAA